MAKRLHCPICHGTDWASVEEIQATTPCKIELASDGMIEIELLAEGEFVREGGTSVVMSYLCIRCGRSIQAEDLSKINKKYFE